MEKVYICSPYRGDIEKNTELARRASRYAVDKGYLPIAPHLLFPQFMEEETEREKALEMNYFILRVCHELWIIGDRLTAGMKTEINKAAEMGIKIKAIDIGGE